MKNDLLRNARDDHGWTQERLAEELNVGVETVRAWESGRRNPGAAMRKRLCEIFGKTAVELGLAGPRPTVPLSDLLDAREKEAPQNLLEIFEPEAEDTGTPHLLLDMPSKEPTLKKRKTRRGRRMVVLVSSLTVLISMVYFIFPRFAFLSTAKGPTSSPSPTTGLLSSRSPTPTIKPTPTPGATPTTGATPTIEPTPTPGATPTTGPTPTPGAIPPSFAISFDRGPLDFQGYCKALGNTAALDQNDASGWRCVTASGSRLPVDTDTACQWQHPQSNSLSRMVNFSDPNDWHCYGQLQNLGGVSFDQYCQSLGLVAHLSGQTVYGWRCASSTDNGQFIDVNSACLQQYKGFESMASITNYFDPNGWRCIGIRLMITQ